MKNFFILVLMLLFVACGHCIQEQTRCNGQTVQICNAAENWENIMQCDNIEPGQWTCEQPTTETNTDTDAECLRGDDDA